MSLAKEVEIFLDAIKKNLIEHNCLTKLGKKKNYYQVEFSEPQAKNKLNPPPKLMKLFGSLKCDSGPLGAL